MNNRPLVISSLLFGFGLALTALAWWSTIEHMAILLWTVDVFAHGQLVPLISLALIWSRRDGLRQKSSIYVPGAFVVLVAVLLWVSGQALDAALFKHVALITVIQGLTLLCFGKRVFRHLLFPMLFLYLTVPFGYAAIQPLQYLTAEVVIKLLGFLGVPYEADGVLIELSSGLYEVAQACAGVKFLFTSMVTGILLANLVFDSWRRRVMIVGVSLLLPIVANIIRVLTILLIAESTDQSFAKDVDHIVYGWVFLSIVLFLLISFAYWVSDRPFDAIENADSSKLSSDSALVKLSGAPISAIVVSFVFLALSPFIFPAELKMTIADAQHEAVPLFRSPPQGYRLLPQASRIPKPFFSNADRRNSAFLRRSASIYAVHVASFEELAPGQRLFQAGHAIASRTWQPIAGRSRWVETTCGFKVREKWWSRNGQTVMTWEAKVAGSEVVHSSVTEKLLTLRARFSATPLKGHIVVIASEILSFVDSEEGLEKLRVSFNYLLEAGFRQTFKQGNSPCVA